jgi:hypothetical protein
MYLRSFWQLERLNFAFLYPTARTNVVATVELGYSPDRSKP